METSGPIYGGNLTWRPSPLTFFDGYWEERFYGPSYQYQFTHRQRRVATTISGYRTITTYPQVLFQIPSTNSVSGLLDAILVARFPDPVERAQQAQDLIARQGLPESLPAGAVIYNQSANVLTGANASWALIGVRNTLALNLFYLKTETLPDPRVPPSFLILNNSIQQGGGPLAQPSRDAGGRPERRREHEPDQGLRRERGPGHAGELRDPAGQLAGLAAQHALRRRALPGPDRIQRDLARARAERSRHLRRTVPPPVADTMYEDFYGLSGKPFQLSPDPTFYFGSKGHESAYSYLKYGVYQGEGFLVITGEVGAGKTTLVRALLEHIDPNTIVAAQIVSTQLEADDLLRSVAKAFGIRVPHDDKANLIASIEAFLLTVFQQGKRALLVIDEAQNLNARSIEELRMLSNFQYGDRALLQSFLVGQPELRTLMRSASMEQFRQRIIASYHLGPLDEAETRGYIEHRLQRVGWKGTPEFDESAIHEIFMATGGIPRRINAICNRLMLAGFLAGQQNVHGGRSQARRQRVHRRNRPARDRRRRCRSRPPR